MKILLFIVLGKIVAAPIFAVERRTSSNACYPITLADSPSDAPRFDHYPAPTDFAGRPAPPNLSNDPLAKRYRTMLRQGVRDGPNFAGHFTIVGWGCGTSCLQFAIVDARTGRVVFSRDYTTVSTVRVSKTPDEPAPQFNGLRFQRNSRLLVLLGAPNEDKAREGISYLEWDSKSLRELYSVRGKRTWCGIGTDPQ